MAMGDDLRTRASRGTWFQLSSAAAWLLGLFLPLLSNFSSCGRLPDRSDGVLLGVLRSSAKQAEDVTPIVTRCLCIDATSSLSNEAGLCRLVDAGFPNSEAARNQYTVSCRTQNA